MRIYKEDVLLEKEDVFIQKNHILKGTKEDKHTHEFIELVYILSGSGEHIINDKKYPVEKGNILFINFNQVHSYTTDSDMDFFNLIMKPEFINKKLLNSRNIYEIFYLLLSEEFGEMENDMPIVKLSGTETIMMDRLCENCLYEYDNKKKGYLSVIRNYIQIVFTLIMRNINRGDVTRKYIRPLLLDIVKFIDENYGEKITIKSLADKCFYNTAYFSTIFKECYGTSCRTYIKEKRLSEAIELLKNTNLSVEEIMAKVGYNDRSLFYRHLKKFSGQTPGDIREKNNIK